MVTKIQTLTVLVRSSLSLLVTFRGSLQPWLKLWLCEPQGRRILVQSWDTRRRGHYSGFTYAAIPADVVDH